MKTIFLPTANNFYPEGTKVKRSFEGKITRGTLHDENFDKSLIAFKTESGRICWSHCSHVTLDR
jgi:hypothetical protein